jgi:hypothetical protein
VAGGKPQTLSDARVCATPLFRYKQHQVFREFPQDVIDRVGIGMVSLDAPEMDALVELAAKFKRTSMTLTSTAPPQGMG